MRSVEPLTASLEDKEEYVCRCAAELLYKIGLSAGKDKLAPAVEVVNNHIIADVDGLKTLVDTGAPFSMGLEQTFCILY